MTNKDGGHHLNTTFIRWGKSSYSYPNGNECVEVSFNDNAVGIRDSHHPDDTVLAFYHSHWTIFLNSIAASQFRRG